MQFGVKWKNLLGILVFFVAQSAFAYRVITDRIALGKGSVYSFVEYSRYKTPTAIGVVISGASLKTLPDDMQMFELIPKGKNRVPPFDHIGFDWNPMGHEPPGIYDLPHFDFHFYIVPRHIRHNITCAGADEANCLKSIEPTFIPANYSATPAGVPMMGWHWIDLTSPEFNGQIFTRTFIYGYYKGITAFLEPMITLKYLKSKPQAAFPVAQQSAVSKNGYYPKNYTVKFNPIQDIYEVALTNLVYRSISR